MITLPSLAVGLPLALVCALAFSVETALGFGATLITVALGSFVLDLRTLLPALVPLNLVLSIYLATRYRREIDLRFLFTRLVPVMGLGLPVGMLAFRSLDASLLKRAFGAFLAIVSAVELARTRRPEAQAPLGRAAETAMLLAGGMIHGAFATGGPMAVYVTGRVLTDKGVYRATLSTLWAILNGVLLAYYVIDARLDATARGTSVALVPSIAIGMIAGEIAFRRVSATTFRALVFATLLASGLLLVVRG